MNTQITDCNALLRLPEVLKRYPVSRSKWYQGIKDGKYPRPVKLGERCSAWRLTEINKLIDEAGRAN